MGQALRTSGATPSCSGRPARPVRPRSAGVGRRRGWPGAVIGRPGRRSSGRTSPARAPPRLSSYGVLTGAGRLHRVGRTSCGLLSSSLLAPGWPRRSARTRSARSGSSAPGAPRGRAGLRRTQAPGAWGPRGTPTAEGVRALAEAGVDLRRLWPRQDAGMDPDPTMPSRATSRGRPRRDARSSSASASLVQAPAPEATETLSYDMPTFLVDGTAAARLGAWKQHLAIYPLPPAEDLDADAAAESRRTAREPARSSCSTARSSRPCWFDAVVRAAPRPGEWPTAVCCQAARGLAVGRVGRRSRGGRANNRERHPAPAGRRPGPGRAGCPGLDCPTPRGRRRRPSVDHSSMARANTAGAGRAGRTSARPRAGSDASRPGGSSRRRPGLGYVTRGDPLADEGEQVRDHAGAGPVGHLRRGGVPGHRWLP